MRALRTPTSRKWVTNDLGKAGFLCRLMPSKLVWLSGFYFDAATVRMEACQSGRMGLPAKELSLRGPQVQILSPPQEYLRTGSFRKVGIGAFSLRCADSLATPFWWVLGAKTFLL